MSTPTEIMAQTIAIHALGYSCRGIEKQLRERFLNQHVPRYGAIARWVGRRPIDLPAINGRGQQRGPSDWLH